MQKIICYNNVSGIIKQIESLHHLGWIGRMEHMNFAIDVMGGDNAPQAVLEGVKMALPKLPAQTELTLYGSQAVLDEAIAAGGIDVKRVNVVYTTEEISCDESPTVAIRKKKDSSMVRALTDVAQKKADCIISAGSSGALLTGATLIVRRLPGVKRPALAVVLPAMEGCTLLIDCGANTDCKTEYLNQFAVMGAAYMQRVMGVKNPRVGLLNNGAEEEKGNELTKAAYQVLKTAPVNFVGNCEARDVLSGNFDVVVADGFDGNVLLKSIEGTAGLMMKLLKQYMFESTRTKVGALLAKPAFKKLKKNLDYSEYGGAPLLGVTGGVIKAHGSSDAKAIMNAILQAQKLMDGQVIDQIAQGISALAVAED